jgi:ABC-type oligopeptide transport system, periplasmic component
MPPLPPAVRWIASLLALAFLASCSSRETPVEKATRDRTLILGNAAEPADLDPQLMTAYTDGNIHMALFEGLTALDENSLQVLPSSAERWETSADGLTWTFHLRADLRWSNGEPVLASDFVASWRRLVSPALASDNAYLLYPVKHAAAITAGEITDLSQLGVAAPDDRTVVVTLERPTPWFAQLTAAVPTFALNPRTLAAFDATARRGTAWTRPGNLVGSGPFALADWRPQAHVTVRKNPHHWQAASVALESIVFLPTDNPDVDERNFRAGQVHATQNLPIAKIADWRRRAATQLRIDPLTQSNFLRFNTTRPPLDDARIRRALSLAIDRDTFARTILQSTRAPPSRSPRPTSPATPPPPASPPTSTPPGNSSPTPATPTAATSLYSKFNVATTRSTRATPKPSKPLGSANSASA